MKRYIAITLLLITVACAGETTVDTNNVSLESYKAALVRNQTNLSNIQLRLIKAREESRDLSAVIMRPLDWWDAQIYLIGDTMTLNSATIAGVKS